MIRDCKLIAEKNKIKFKFIHIFQLKVKFNEGVIVAEDNYKLYIDSIFNSLGRWSNLNDEKIVYKIYKI